MSQDKKLPLFEAALVKPALWQDDNGKFISLDHTIALGSNGISLSDYYGGNTTTTQANQTPVTKQ